MLIVSRDVFVSLCLSSASALVSVLLPLHSVVEDNGLGRARDRSQKVFFFYFILLFTVNPLIIPAFLL